MTLKDKAKTYNFWISLVSAAVLIARIVGDKFNIFIDTTLIMDITTGLCSIFVILGILSAPKSLQSNIVSDIKNCDSSTNNVGCEEGINNNALISETNKVLSEETITNNEIVEIKPDTHTSTEENTSIDNTKNETKIERTEFSLLEIIEKLKAEIHQANKLIQDFPKENN